MAKKRDDRGVNEKCFAEVRDALAAIPEEKVAGPNLDLEAVAMAGLVLVDRARKDDRAAFLAKLAPAFIEANLIDKLETTCLAAQYIVDNAATEGATEETYKVDAALVEQATATKKRMIKTIEYNLENVDSVRREVDDIKLGTGYMDLAQDLSRLAKVYDGLHGKALVHDKVNYRATDKADARTQAEAIRKQYRASKSKERDFDKMRPRAYAEVQRLYNELRDAAQFAYRHHPEISDEFEALRTAVGVVNSRKPGKGEEITPEGEKKPV